MKTRGEEENSATGLNNLFPVWASMYRTAVRMWPCALLAMVWHDFDIWVEDRLAKKIANESWQRARRYDDWKASQEERSAMEEEWEEKK